MLQAGVIVSDCTTLIVEILKDNARPEAGEVYGAMDMGWAKLVGQIPRPTESEWDSSPGYPYCRPLMKDSHTHRRNSQSGCARVDLFLTESTRARRPYRVRIESS